MYICIHTYMCVTMYMYMYVYICIHVCVCMLTSLFDNIIKFYLLDCAFSANVPHG